MCLATPVRVLKLEKNKALVDAWSKKSEVDVSLLKNVKIGDYLYSSHGLAIKKVARAEAEEVLKLVKSWR
ncbi:MAG: hypothetical protein A2126_04155 [Candidatus Woykebacteria bacterium GWB1_45_5]|uniref:Hydrogenase assembly protein HupF n=2 Tax=Candidatus Woykeibacteriota TaxID=1817899 RepID=A0A1G1W1E8_9BACT|nr:MAG: hypothetical protein A2113_01960 [Candidatus Woykebacteria bacterium GWA1_44_8]OGY22337.1 MAG: hypothetical protein A2126_04155 [Candidatus Woykebacteria bacterium GWB1_45_5]